MKSQFIALNYAFQFVFNKMLHCYYVSRDIFLKIWYLCIKWNRCMKVLLINGSPHKEGNAFIALSEVAKALNGNGIETEIVSIGVKAVQGCIACGRCV